MSASLTTWQKTIDNAVVAALFFLTAWAGQTLAFPPFNASVVCPASGIALAATVLRGLHVWPGVLVGTFAILVKVLIFEGGVPVEAGLACSLLVGAAQAVQAYVGGILFQRWVADRSFGTPGAAVRYTFVAALSAAIGSAGAVGALIGFGFVKADLLAEIAVWSIGRTAGMLIFTPAFVLLASVRDYTLVRQRSVEAGLLFTLVLTVSAAVFGLSEGAQRHYPLEYVVFPFLLWALVRFGSRELAVLVALVSVIATFATAHRLGPFAFGNDPNASLMLMELYFAVMTISSLLGGAVVAQRNRAQRELEAAHRELEERVVLRTQELRHVNADLELEIAERRRTEARLHLLARAFEHSGEPALITDASMHIISVNPAFSAVTGYSAAEINGRDLNLLAALGQGKGLYEQLLTRLGAAGEAKGELLCRRGSQATFPAWLSIAPVRDPSGNAAQYVITLTDITEQKAAEERTTFLAHHDALTGLPNRALLREILDRTLAYARRRESSFAVLFADLDHFKPINDSYGHAVGDKLLKAVVERLSAGQRDEDTLARLGGDEFVLVLSDIANADQADNTAKWMLQQLALPFLIDGHELRISSSIGISLYPEHAQSVDDLLSYADAAMYQAKASGRNTSHCYSADLDQHNQRRSAIEQCIRNATTCDGLRLLYQPRFDQASGRVRGVEAFLRLAGPEGRWLMPADFLPFAEETALIVPIGEWALRQACHRLREWALIGLGDLSITVNISPAQFQHSQLGDVLTQILDQTRANPARLELDLDESMVMSDSALIQASLRQIRSLGVRLAIDDFGYGYSCLTRLQQLPVEKIKINIGNAQESNSPLAALACVDAMAALGHGLGLQVGITRVETAAVADHLRQGLCDEIQGDFLCQPMSEHVLVNWLSVASAEQRNAPRPWRFEPQALLA